MSRRLVAGILVGVVLVAAVAVSPRRALAVATALAADPWRLFLALLVLAAVRPFLAWPVSLLAGIVGYGYGLVGLPLGWGLMVATSVPPYLLGDRGRTTVGAEGRIAEATRRLTNAGERAVAVVGPFRSVAVARFAPIPSDVISVAAGVSGVRLTPFLAGTAVGEFPWAVAAVVAGASAKAVTTDGLTAAFDPRLVAALAVAAVLLLVGPLIRHAAE